MNSKRIIKISAIVVGSALLILIILPFLINVNSFRPRLESELSTALGRQVKVGNLALSILGGSVSAEDLSISDDPAFSKGPFVKAKSLTVGVELMPLLFSKTLHVTNLTLDHPEFSLLRSDSGTWNFSSLGAKTKAAEKAPANEPKGSTLSIAEMKVKDGRVSVNRANSTIQPHTYQKVNITVTDFSSTSQFPFTLSADLPGGGNLKADGKCGPIPADASLTPFQAKIKVKHLDLVASGFAETSSGISGLIDFDGTLTSDGKRMLSKGTLTADKLKLAEKGSPAQHPIEVTYAVDHDLQKQGGRLTQGDVIIGKALAQLTGTYQTQGASTLLNMKLSGQNMPVDDLQVMLPSLGVMLPSGSSLQGGTLSTTLLISGLTEKLVINGPIRLVNTRLAGFSLGSKLSAVSALSGGGQSGSDTSIQNFSTDARVAPEGIRTDNINLTIPALGVVTGAGTISPGGALDYKMSAALSGGAVSAITQLAGLGGKNGSVPFFIRGTTSNPSVMPDVQGMMGGQLKSGIPGVKGTQGQSAVDALSGLFGKKKQK